MKFSCWPHPTGQRLQTWIPVLIVVQCGLIVLYISIVQHDKEEARTGGGGGGGGGGAGGEGGGAKRADPRQYSLHRPPTIRMFQSNFTNFQKDRYDHFPQKPITIESNFTEQKPAIASGDQYDHHQHPNDHHHSSNILAFQPNLTHQNAAMATKDKGGGAQNVQQRFDGLESNVGKSLQHLQHPQNDRQMGAELANEPGETDTNDRNELRTKRIDQVIQNLHRDSVKKRGMVALKGNNVSTKPEHLRLENRYNEKLGNAAEKAIPGDNSTGFGRWVDREIQAGAESNRDAGSVKVRKNGEGNMVDKGDVVEGKSMWVIPRQEVVKDEGVEQGQGQRKGDQEEAEGEGDMEQEGAEVGEENGEIDGEGEEQGQGEQEEREVEGKGDEKGEGEGMAAEGAGYEQGQEQEEGQGEEDGEGDGQGNEVRDRQGEEEGDGDGQGDEQGEGEQREEMQAEQGHALTDRNDLTQTKTNNHTNLYRDNTNETEIENLNYNANAQAIDRPNPLIKQRLKTGAVTTQNNALKFIAHGKENDIESTKIENKMSYDVSSLERNQTSGLHNDKNPGLQKKQPAGLLQNPTLQLQPNLFHDFKLDLPPTFHLQDDHSVYFTRHARNLTCLAEGTSSVFIRDAQAACICRPSWNGAHCSVPDAAMYTSALRYMNSLRPLIYHPPAPTGPDATIPQSSPKGAPQSHAPRRIINAITFNVEWELLEARLFELGDLVDVYIIAESNYTQYGERKPLRLLERLKTGYLREFHHKILYLFVDTFPESGKEDGWVVDQFARTYISKHGLSNIKGLRSDDLFIYTDADELPSRETLLFLKLHHGYPEPFGLALRWSVFGFFWKQFDLTRIMVGCSVEVLRRVFGGDAYRLRTVNYAASEAGFSGSWGGVLMEWYIGDGGAHAGWHCSWCMPPDRIRIKLTSALNADFPRWGDFPEKRDLTYIRNLVKTGTWFDDKTTFNSLVNKDSDPVLAPAYMMEHFSKYQHLLDLNCVK